LADNPPDSRALALSSFNGDLSVYLKENKPSFLILNSIPGDINVPPGVKKNSFASG
jgi:DUF4097 and DUF4098 domain-containing protein YvlB